MLLGFRESVRIMYGSERRIIFLQKNFNAMKIDKIIFKDTEGQQRIYNWRCYFAELIRSRRYELEENRSAPVMIEEGYCYLIDIHREVIWDSGISIPDLEKMGDLMEEELCLYLEWKPRDIPWVKIGYDIAKRFRKIKAIEAQEAVKKKTEDRKKLKKEKVDKERDDQERNDEVYVIKSGKEWAKMGLREEDKKCLWLSLWREREICFLFADSNIGKSIYALQMAFHIAKTQKVIYFDYEMDFKEFQSRCTGHDKSLYMIPDGFMRCEPNRDIFLDNNADEILVREIERVIEREGAKVIIIDNITFITRNSQSSAGASVLMYRLKLLQRKYGISMLILAHTPKRNMRLPLTQNDLAGSKKLFNFADSGFAIGQSYMDNNLQYVKQLKARGGEIEYGRDNVILIERRFSDNWLHFETIGYDAESNHIRESKDSEREKLRGEIIKMQANGLSQREMAKILKISAAKVNILMKDCTSGML